jgi:hypothetical protein
MSLLRDYLRWYQSAPTWLIYTMREQRLNQPISPDSGGHPVAKAEKEEKPLTLLLRGQGNSLARLFKKSLGAK